MKARGTLKGVVHSSGGFFLRWEAPHFKGDIPGGSLKGDGYECLGITFAQKLRWEIAILESIKSLGGEARLQQIYKRLPDFKHVTEEHLRITYGRPAYQHQARRHITNLRRAGELIWISRGRYFLTEKGMKRADIEKEKRRT